MSQLVDFYRGQGTDSAGRSLAQIWAWDDDSFEAVHDFIQWLFPLPEPSRFNPSAPLLRADDIADFQGDAQLRENLGRSAQRILSFLGLALAEDGTVVEAAHFADRAGDVWEAPNHNWLRISRILRALTLLGQGELARALYERLRVFYASRRFPIDAETFRYWTQAVQS